MIWTKDQMARAVIRNIPKKSIVNLGIGLPSLVAENLSNEDQIIIQSENGVLGINGRPNKANLSHNIINAGKETVSISKGGSFFDSSMSFGMIRGGHIDVTVLGGMEVDIHGNLANWKIPGKKITGMGGAMDLVHGPKIVIVMMSQYNKNNEIKLVDKCKLPLTGERCVNIVVTEYGVMKVSNEKFNIIEIADSDLSEHFLNTIFKV